MTRVVAALARHVLGLFPHDEISIDDEPYMRRFYLAGWAPPIPCTRCEGAGAIVDDRYPTDDPAWHLTCPLCDGVGHFARGWWWRRTIGAVRVHEILTSDDARAFHDHPWPSISIGVHGTYVEERPRWTNAEHGTCAPVGDPTNFRARFRAPWITRRTSTALHALTLDDGPAWTIFITGRKERTWGFSDPNGWTPWRTFDAEHPGRDSAATSDTSSRDTHPSAPPVRDLEEFRRGR